MQGSPGYSTGSTLALLLPLSLLVHIRQVWLRNGLGWLQQGALTGGHRDDVFLRKGNQKYFLMVMNSSHSFARITCVKVRPP